MVLTIDQIKEKLKQPKNKSVISQAVQHENRLKLHGETTLTKSNAAVNDFLSFVRSLLPNDKYNNFVNLFGYPVQTLTLTKEIYTALSKVFDGRNPVFQFNFVSDDVAQDWQQYLKQFKLLDKFQTQGFEMMKTAINSIVVVDLPSEQTTPKPEPYFYFLDISNVIDFKLKSESEFEFIAFNQDKNRIAFFDSQSYKVFERNQQGEIKTPAVVDNQHNLGFCPVRFFWSTPLNYKNPAVKRSPISDVLSKLDMLLFYQVSNEHLNTFGRYPIYSGFRANCDFEDIETGQYCNDGFLRTETGSYLMQGGKPASCPVCSKKRLAGAGSFIEIEPPTDANDGADLRNPVQITTIDVQSLEYNQSDIEKRKTEIYAAVTGFKGLPVNNQAVNEKQVLAIFETLETALSEPQKNIENCMQWVAKTAAALRYKPEYVKGVFISLGTEHYILTAQQLLELYQTSKQSGVSSPTLDVLEMKYIETEYKNNPEQLQREKIILNVDPFRHKTDAEVGILFDKGLISKTDYLVKINFSTFILRFERENISLNEFATGVSFSQKIDTIKKTFAEYANEIIKKTEPAPAEG